MKNSRPHKAVDPKIQKLRFQRALQKAKGCWSDKNHPDLNTQADINRFLARFRSNSTNP